MARARAGQRRRSIETGPRRSRREGSPGSVGFERVPEGGAVFHVDEESARSRALGGQLPRCDRRLPIGEDGTKTLLDQAGERAPLSRSPRLCRLSERLGQVDGCAHADQHLQHVTDMRHSSPSVPARARRRWRVEVRGHDEHGRRRIGELAGQSGPEVIAEAVNMVGGESEAADQRREVRGGELGSEQLLTGVLLVVPEHAVAPIVDEDHRERQLLLGKRRARRR